MRSEFIDTIQNVKLICCPVNHTGPNPQNQSLVKALAVIPARFYSTRFPGKVLSEIGGKPMVIWVAEKASAAHTVARVIVATDNARVADVVLSQGYEVMMTRSDHPSGTDRLAEVVSQIDAFEIVVNVQGDEPLISPDTIDRAVLALESAPDAGIATTWERIDNAADVLSPDVVKIVIDQDSRAVYFSRSPVPFPRDAVDRLGSLENALKQEPELIRSFRKHTGLYVYRRDVLLQFTTWPATELEKSERLEQLRALERGVKIVAVESATTSIGVDTLADLKRVEKVLAKAGQRITSEFAR